jgi:hypothetical protein
MRNGLMQHRWVLAPVAIALVTSVGGWFFIDGLNQIAELVGTSKVPSSGDIRAFSAIAMFMAGLALEVVLWSRATIRQALATGTENTERGLRDGVAKAVESAVLQSLWPVKAGPEHGALVTRLLSTFVDDIARIPSMLLPGYSVLIEAHLAETSAAIRVFESHGSKVSVSAHLEMTRRLSVSATSFLQINRRAFKAPGEWTKQWCAFVEEMGQRRDVKTEYIVLMPAAELNAHVREIKSMDRYLRGASWSLSVCDDEDVKDALGGSLSTMSNVDVYDTRVAKLQSPPGDGGYVGGIDLELRFVELIRDPDLARFIDATRQFARPARAFLRDAERHA